MLPNLDELIFKLNKLRPEFEEELASPGGVEGDFHTRGSCVKALEGGRDSERKVVGRNSEE